MDEQGQQTEANGMGQSKMNGASDEKGSGHGRQSMAGKQKPAEQATAGGHNQRILRPAQASQPTNGPQLAGLAAKTTAACW